MKEPIVFGAPYLDDDMIAEVVACLRSGWWQAGPRVERLEAEVKRRTGAKHCVAVSSATAGIHLVLMALKIDQSTERVDEVVTSPICWASVPGAIELAGAQPVFADVDPRTGNLDPHAVAGAITPHTRAILPVHLAGRTCDMDAIMEIAQRHSIPVVEDASHAFGASWKGRATGTFGVAGVFSFNRAKNIAAAEGGAVITNDEHLASAVRLLAHGGVSRGSWERFSFARDYEVVSAGLNCKMPDLAAAMLLPQLARFEEFQTKRATLWTLYDSMLRHLPISQPPRWGERSVHAMHLYQVRLPAAIDRDQVRARMWEGGIGTGIHYRPLHQEPYYGNSLGSSLPGAEEFGRTTLSLPFSVRVTEADVLAVSQALEEALS
ncbi:DegT/DnrJ/EryC1/StrS family aminotransferase [Candidatus Methylomirabilis sp.]|uniref:DegT/DnrJ/EryC1/StrS family aminotransferase n=1 Tax=Candidatus Methylomirabilis tolerans TaxID=3123416 RepID=A0AAJ1AFZ9_9BACT|nr:DegT/DnrJ/EryC1/StrS family aminotransferase [Candidatus Methylomirabilis sp.]